MTFFLTTKLFTVYLDITTILFYRTLKEKNLGLNDLEEQFTSFTDGSVDCFLVDNLSAHPDHLVINWPAMVFRWFFPKTGRCTLPANTFPP